ncbi:helix-turn-helix transcriptional regulator [Embleya sp. NBC_00896]|uniref:helix-turn-helix domain-containing protein n=1 Tax=Embleya sp. NBC_00896 TaxID=2975961 RepID=UPI002F911A3F|nr:helix-turn-helix domain-containing protein [Embleya sp. NBC_00896]
MASTTGPGNLKARRDLGDELRKIRGKRTATSVAADLGVSPSTVTRTETGERVCTEEYFHALADALGVTGDKRQSLEELAIAVWDADPPWWAKFADVLSANYAALLEYEESARRRRDFQINVIPAHLQTPDYSEGVTAVDFAGLSRDTIDDLVAIRLERQRRVFEGPEPRLELEAVVTEAVLRFEVGGSAVHREQLARLLEATELPNVSLRVIPFTAGAGGSYTSPFQILSYDGEQPDVVFGQGVAGSTFMNEPREVRRFDRLFTNLCKHALSPDDSRALIATIKKDTT